MTDHNVYTYTCTQPHSSFSWSSDEQTIAYVAENKSPTRESAFRASSSSSSAASPMNETPVNKYEYVEVSKKGGDCVFMCGW